MNYKYFLFVKSFFTLFLSLYIFCASTKTNLKAENIGSNIEIFTEVLRGAGLGFKEAKKASDSFKRVYPPERLTEKSYLIMPPLGKEINVFAVNIDNLEAVLIIKSDKDFIAHITTLNEAKKIFTRNTGGLSNIDNILPLVEKKKTLKKKKNNIVEREIFFEEGSTLFGLLYINYNKKKDIGRAINQFKKFYDPSKIRVGTKGKIYKSKKNELLAFYIKIKKNKSILVGRYPTGYKAKILDSEEIKNNIDKLINNSNKNLPSLKKTMISLFNETQLDKREIKIDKGSNFLLTLKKENIENRDIYKIIKKVENFYDLKTIKANQKIKVVYLKNKLYGIAIKLDNLKELQLVKMKNDFVLYIFEKPFKRKTIYSKIIINTNLYMDAKKAQLPIEIFIEMVKLLSYSIDFQRDLKSKEVFKILYENLYDYKNNFIMSGDILYIKVDSEGKNAIEMFKFNSQKNTNKYYDAKGNSIRKKLMRTPIDGARLSSGYGKRVHPILGYTKLHKGLDFAAKKGTPVFAAGDGVVERANRYGGYGNYVRIKHNSEYKTAYAHLSKFAKGLRKGKYVKQGNIIGFVGSTGRSTGPHLHYEIILNDRQINPYKLKLPDGEKLEENLIEDFNKEKKRVLEKLKLFNDS